MLRRLVPSILLALACVLVAAAAAPAAGALTRDAQTRQNVRLLQIYIERYAAGKAFVYPTAAVVRKGGGLTAPVWPVNPWTAKPMAPGRARGAYTYALAADGSYALVGHLSSGPYAVTGQTPEWLVAERAGTALAEAHAEAAELGARVVKGYIEQWGMLNNGTAPAVSAVAKSGDVGALFAYWPDNPYTGQPMKAGGAQGDFSYSQGGSGAYSLTAVTSPAATVPLDGAVPQQLRTALENLKSDLTNANIWKVQRAVDQYALDNNDALPVHADQATLGLYLDPWPANPWFGNTPMTDSTVSGNYSYAVAYGANAYTITAHVSGGGAGDVVNGDWRTAALGIRDRLKNLCCQAEAQALKEYVEEWKAAHAGTSPTADQFSRTGAVGLLHAWWPADPWTGSAMVNVDGLGDFQYAPGADGAYTLTVRQQLISPFTQYYTPL